MGCGLAVGQLFLVQEIEGSNPSTPATYFSNQTRSVFLSKYPRVFRGLPLAVLFADPDMAPECRQWR